MDDTTRTTTDVDTWRPFPTEALPDPLRSFVAAGAEAMGCDASYLALPLLAATASAIGNTRRLRLKRGWDVPAIVWGAVVGESGTTKTPAFRAVMRPLRDRQQRALKAHEEAMRQHDGLMQVYEASRKAWQGQIHKRKDGEPPEPPPEKPEPPHAERCIASSTTMEALAPILLRNPRGVLVAQDELNGWLGSFDRYAGGKGSDAAHWLSMYSADTIIVDRKTGIPPTIYVPHAAVSIIGGIQPSTLHRALGREHRENGLAARLLLTFPPRYPKRWTEAEIGEDVEDRIGAMLDSLFDLLPTENDEGEPLPVLIRLTPEAKAVWLDYYRAHNEEQVELFGDLAAAWSKLEEYAARLALVCYLAREAGRGRAESATALDDESMEAGVALATWFKHQALRCYGLLGQTEDDREQAELMKWIRQHGGRCTARELARGPRQYRALDDAHAALVDLAKAGMGRWETVPSGQRGGRSTRVFVLATGGDGDGTHVIPGDIEVPSPSPVSPRQNNGHAEPTDINAILSVAADEPEDDWGEL